MNTQPQATLYHYPLDPFCRRLRLALAEHAMPFTLVEEKPWAVSETLLGLNPAGEVPVYVDEDGTIAAGALAAGEYVEEKAGAESSLLGETPAERAETRRLLAWFDGRFYAQVSAIVLMEKGLKRYLPTHMGGGAPDVNRLRMAAQALPEHLSYIGRLAEERGLLAGPRLSLADLAAAAHLSVLEYLDALRWEDQESAKLWYQRIKSRPSFRPLLKDRLPGLTPPGVYAELDF